MKTKQELLNDLQSGLDSGILTESDIRPFVSANSIVTTSPEPEAKPKAKSDDLSAVDIMFYIAGIVLFSTVMSVIIQSWDSNQIFTHILLSAVLGVFLWLVAYYLIKNQVQTDIRKGLANALLLTGSLLVVVGGYIITNQLVGGFDQVDFMPTAFTLAVVGALHIGFDRLIKQKLILLMGILLAVSSFPSLIFSFLQDSSAPFDIWASVLIITAGVLAYATRVVGSIYSDRKSISSSFDFLAAFVALMAMYVASYGDNSALWFCILIMAVFGLFYLSIVLQNRHLLGSGSFFMVLTIITISFRFFSGYGISFSLIVATLGLLGSAAVAASINKNYFK